MPRIILLGAPGSGKGTQATFFASDYGVPVISTGDLLRKNIAENTALGIEAHEYMEKGELVPDELVIKLVKERFAEGDAVNGWLLDGFPRTEQQAEALDDLLESRGKKLDRVFLLSVTKEELIERITGRLICPKCGRIYHVKTMPPAIPGICDVDRVALIRREDDNIETANNRIDVYREQTKPLIDYYTKKDLLTEINGMIGRDQIEEVIRETIGPPQGK